MYFRNRMLHSLIFDGTKHQKTDVFHLKLMLLKPVCVLKKSSAKKNLLKALAQDIYAFPYFSFGDITCLMMK